MNSEINDAINEVTIDCPECKYMGDDEQYTCTTCWCMGGSGRINVVEYIKEHGGIRDLKVQSKWKPITTAPKNGTHCIFWSNTHGQFIGYIPESMAHYKKIHAIVYRGTGQSIVVSAWMPCPDAPSEERA